MAHDRKKIKKRSRTETRGEGGMLMSSLFGALAALISSVLLLIIGTAIASVCADPDKILGALSIASLYISALVGGFVSVKRNGGGALLCGLISGFILALFFFALSLCFTADYSSGYSVLVKFVIRAGSVLASVLGAFAALHKPERRRKRR